MGRYKKLIVIPCVIIIVSIYLIGVNIVRRVDRVDEIGEAVPVSEQAYESGTEILSKSEAEEKAELEKINDKININTATASELCLLDGIGEKTAELIIKKREELGGFVSIEQLLEIDGIGQKKFDEIRDYIKTE